MNIHHIIECSSSFFWNIYRKSFDSFSHLIIHPTYPWSYSTDNSNCASSFPMINCCGLASLWGSISGLPDLPRCISSLTTDYAWVSSWHKPRWDLSITFPLLRRPKHDYHPSLKEKLSTKCSWLIAVKCGLSVAADIGSLVFPVSQWLCSRDFDFHSFSSRDLLKSKMIRSTAPLQ